MKLKKGFVLSKINNKHYAVPVGPMAQKHRILIQMNSTCLFVWNQLQKDTTEREILDAITREYEVAPDVAQQDLSRFLEALRNAKLLED